MDYQYNSLNLLSEVNQGSTSKAKYVYAADGTKLGVLDAGGNGYDYRGSLIYKRSGNALSLESAEFSDGRITKTNSSYVPNYFITDHLGSVRVIFDASGTILEQNDYYAFGEKHLNSSLTASDNRFKFNGKELQTTGDVGFLDYGARMYDSKLGRWFGQDPAEQFSSPYNFCGNNPTVLIDKNGKLADWFYNEKTGDVYYNNTASINSIGIGKLAGEGWCWLGKNGVFENKTFSDEISILQSTANGNGSLFNYNKETNRMSSEWLFKGKDAELFMAERGYFKAPRIAKVHTTTVTEYSSDINGKPYKEPDITETIDEMISLQYVKNGSHETKIFIGNYRNTMRGQRGLIPYSNREDRWEILEFNYQRPTLGNSGLLNIILDIWSKM